MNGLTLVAPIRAGRAVWHVSLGVLDPASGQRQAASLTGAWVDEGSAAADLDKFTYGRILLEGDKVEESLTQFHAEIIAVRDSLQAEFDAWVRDNKRNLVPPDWPHVPQLNPSLPAAFNTPDQLRAPLAYAVWARGLIAVWSDIEKKRLARPFLRPMGGERPRDFPPAWMSNWGA